MASGVIRIEQVTKRFDGKFALERLSLEVPAHHCLALVGPSGCGKSTLLRVVIGLLRPDEGRILVRDEPLTPASARALRLRMGYVIQEGGLFPHLTAAANAALVARHLGWPEPRIQARLEELAELVLLPRAMLDRYPTQLSGGQRQRVGIMRALMLDPEVLLMDEPLGALDPLVRSGLQDDLKRMFRALRKTVLFVTHDMAEAAWLGDEIALLRDGRLVQRGTMSDLMTKPAEPFVTDFIQAQRRGWTEAR